jgi:uncharacterized protein with PQ loop repeat
LKQDVSRKTFIAFCTGVALWLVYAILGMKIKYG